MPNRVLADGQVAATETAIITGLTACATTAADGGGRLTGNSLNITLSNTSASTTELVVVTLQRQAGTSRRIGRFTLLPNEQAFIVNQPIQPGDILLATTTNALTVDYVVSAGSVGTDMSAFTLDANGVLKQITTASGAATLTDITGTDASLGIAGLAAAQGGAIALVGGTSSTSGNAGGAITGVGGTPGATGIGGAISWTGGAGGATSGAGGAVSLVGGVGTAGNSAGGAVSATGGAGQGSAAGGAGSVVGGVGGATGAGGAVSLTGGAGGATSGTGGAVTIRGGAGSAGNASGGAVTISGGALNGSGGNGTVTIQSAYAPVAGGGTSAAILCTSTAALGIYFGTGAPSFAAAKGSLYCKTDASTSATRLYIATDAAGTWSAYTSAA